MTNTPRKEGYYWVKLSNGQQVIAQWWIWMDKQFGIRCSTMQRMDGTHITVQEIDETRILPQEAPIKTFIGQIVTPNGKMEDLFIELPEGVSLDYFMKAVALAPKQNT